MGGGARLSRDGTAGAVGKAIGAGTGNQGEIPSWLPYPRESVFRNLHQRRKQISTNEYAIPPSFFIEFQMPPEGNELSNPGVKRARVGAAQRRFY